MTSGLALLKEIQDSCTDAERKIADHLIENPKTAVFCTIAELANQAGSNPSAAIRLCKRAGLSGYRELQLLLTKDLYSQDSGQDDSEDSPQLAVELDSNLSVESIAQAVVLKTKEALDRALSLVHPDTIESASALILKARSVAILGAGASANVAYDFFQKLTRIGIVATFSFDADVQTSIACGLDKRDVSVAFSYSGRTETTNASALEAKKSGAALIVVTSVGSSPLEKMAQLVVQVPKTEPLLRTGASLSRSTQLAIVDILYTTIVCRSIENSIPRLERSMKAVHNTSRRDYLA